MKFRLPKLAVRTRKYLSLLAGIAGLVAAVLVAGSISRQVSQRALNFKSKAIEMEPKSREDALADSLLMDSILSIVQSYYVDPARVENRDLLATALASLATNPRIKAGVSSSGAWVELDGERQIFPLKDRLRYQDVLEIYSSLAKLVESYEVELAAGGAPGKPTSGAVTLLSSMLAELDAHSALLSPEAYRELRQGTEGSFGGLGVLVGIRDNLLTVIKPLPRSPAQRAGIRKHDRILGINGVYTYGYSLDDLVEYMRGEPGTEVSLSLLREGATAPSDMVLRREIIQVDSVSTREIDRQGLKVLHLTIENFASRTAREVLSAVKKFRARHGTMHGLVLDLRSNPGGLLDQAVQVADLFLQSGVIVTTRGRREEVESADNGFDEIGFPVAVLLDGDSASASEIVAGALQDHGRAVVIGQPSFGKGSVQTIFELPGERALKLTIARYYTPHGRSIQNIGIIPDLWLQPVMRAEKNENLLGKHRYKNERFLRNHLEASGSGTATDLRPPARKAYYLASTPSEETWEREEDIELDFAVTMFERLRATYGDRVPESGARASHWLGLAGPVIADKSTHLDTTLRSWLKEKHGLDWDPPGHINFNPDLELVLDEDNPTEVVSGGTLRLKWRLKNREMTPLHRVSLYVRSDADGLETKEVLIGSVRAGGVRRGTVEIPIDSSWPAGPLQLRVGVAVDAWPAPLGAVDYLVQVRDRPVAVVSATVALEDAGSKVPGVLEGEERARLRIELANAGTVKAQELKVRLVNLAGSQVDIPVHASIVKELNAGAVRQIYVDIVGGKALYSSEIGLGLHVESPDIKTPLRQRFAIRAQPNAEFSAKEAKAMSH